MYLGQVHKCLYCLYLAPTLNSNLIIEKHHTNVAHFPQPTMQIAWLSPTLFSAYCYLHSEFPIFYLPYIRCDGQLIYMQASHRSRVPSREYTIIRICTRTVETILQNVQNNCTCPGINHVSIMRRRAFGSFGFSVEIATCTWGMDGFSI